MDASPLSSRNARQALDRGARLVDIRDADEHARERIPGAVNLPLDRIAALPRDECPVIFHCKSGMRRAANAAALAAAAAGVQAYILEGGIDARRSAGQPRVVARSHSRSCGRCRSRRVCWCLRACC